MLIYKATINSKSYIGLFSGERHKFNKRKIEHKMDSYGKRDNGYFHNAIRKYGYENIQWEILEDDISNFEHLKERERFNILKYDTFKPNGYNLTLGGEGLYGLKHTEETKNKIRLSNLGKIVSEESIKKFKQTVSNYTTEQIISRHITRSKAQKGKRVSDITKEKISKTLTGRVFSEEHLKKLKKARLTRHEKHCLDCGKLFVGALNSKYCSMKCNNSSSYKRRIQREEYLIYLKNYRKKQCIK